MLDMKRLRENPDEVLKLLLQRGKGDYGLSELLDLDVKRREILQDVEAKKNRQKTASKEVPLLKKQGLDATELLEEMKVLADTIKGLDTQVNGIEAAIEEIMMGIPNTPNATTPSGTNEEDNVEVRKFGNPRLFTFEPKAHWDIGTDLDILDFERGTKIAGTRFTVLKGMGAKLERALINFMLDLHGSVHGFEEVMTPFMVNRDAMTGTGQLPKFEDDMFYIPSKDFFLIPTAEVPVTNLYRDEILAQDQLPIYHTAYTPCFRKEAGSAGKDTRGIIRQHQFNKVEMVKFTEPEKSYEELESLTAAAEEVLKRLGLPYRVIRLCGGDIGFSSAQTYDIEVWLPSYNAYKEISSCSNFEDFQGRRANIRYRDQETGKVRHVHTLNGSGLAVGRTVAAILENYQEADGTVTIPEALRPYMMGASSIGKRK